MIGASPRRKEDRRLLVGVGRFVDDLAREGLLHLAVVRSVQAHARIAKIALAEARALRALTTVEAALASPTRLHDGWPDNAALAVGAAIGDAERALATADIVIHETFRHPRLAAVPIEPRGVLAYRDGDSGALVVWSS